MTTPTLMPAFQSREAQYNARNGESFTVVRYITEQEEDLDDVPCYEIEFKDGVRIHAWPEEVEENHPDAESTLVERDPRRDIAWYPGKK